jgi:hypothetical protein
MGYYDIIILFATKKEKCVYLAITAILTHSDELNLDSEVPQSSHEGPQSSHEGPQRSIKIRKGPCEGTKAGGRR